MSETAIEWTEKVWNPVTGCTRVSAGCDHCYAFQLHDQRHVAWKRGRWENAPEQYRLPFSRVQLLRARLYDPWHWKTPSRVFVNSMGDLFHEAVPDAYIEQVFSVMVQAERHTFQVLTKRPERMATWVRGYYAGMPPAKHIWLGTSVEDQAAADTRVYHLLQTPAAVRFLSCEPLLGPVDLCHVQYEDTVEVDALSGTYGVYRPHGGEGARLDWVIVGGESGRHARPVDPEWVRSLRDQCQAAEVAFFFKQWGGRTPKANGRLLDGREWNEYPR